MRQTNDKGLGKESRPSDEQIIRHIFPEETGNYITQCAAAKSVSPLMYLLGMLTAISAIIGASIKVRAKHGHERFCNIFGAIVAPPGSGKTPIINDCLAPIHAIQKLYYKEYQKALKSHWELSASDRKEAPNPRMKRLITSEATMEAKLELLYYNPLGLIEAPDELSSVVTGANKYNGGSDDMEKNLSLYSNATMYIDRKGGVLSLIESPYFNLIGGTQPSVFRETMLNNSNGFTDRFLIQLFHPQEFRFSDVEIDPAVKEKYLEHCITLRENIEKRVLAKDEFGQQYVEPIVIDLSDSAKEYWNKWSKRLETLINEEGHYSPIRTSLVKLADYTLKVAGLLEMYSTDGKMIPTQISGNTMKRAIWVVRHFKDQLYELHEKLLTDNREYQIDTILRYIKAKKLVDVRVQTVVDLRVAGIRSKGEAITLFKLMAGQKLGIYFQDSKTFVPKESIPKD